MDEIVISWSWENWITIFLMAVTGLAAAGLISTLFHKMRGTGGDAAAS